MKKRAIEELIFENTKGRIMVKLQAEYFEDQIQNTPSEEVKTSLMRLISEKLSLVHQYEVHINMLKKMLKEVER